MSRKRPKTSLVNLLRNKKVAIAAALCMVLAVGAYVGATMFSSQAAPEKLGQQRGTINDLDKDIKGKKSGGNRNIGIGAGQLGSETNPFVILEIVPFQGYGEMSYMVSGCEPANLYQTYTGTSMCGLNAMNMGLAVQYAFPEENYPGKDNKASRDEFGTVSRPWKLSDKEMTLYGYYEKVNPGQTELKPSFVIGGVETDKNGDPHPVFRAAQDGETAEYIWVTLGNSANSIYNNHKKQENKKFDAGITEAQVNAKYKIGDREYTTRTDRAYCMGSMPDETCMYYHSNDFLRYSLKIRSKYEVDHFNLVVKTIEPWELNEQPEWIDYADLMYIHASNEYGATLEFYKTARSKDESNSGGEQRLYIDKNKSKNVQGATFGKYGSGEYKNKQNDITFEVALKLFKKANKYEEYNGSTYSSTDPNLKMDYAPIIIGSTLYQSTFGDWTSSAGIKMMDWETMTVAPDSGVENRGCNNNVYKFCLMSLLMDQTVFYNNFIRKRVSTGKSVIQVSEDGKTGIAEPQSGDAQLYWNIWTFMPYNNNVGHWRAYKDKYKLKTDSGASTAPYYTANQGVNNFTMVYNNNGKIYYLSAEDDITQTNSTTEQAFNWYKEEQKDERESLSTLDIIYYMLHYNKSDTGSNGKDGVIEILDIEPCSDFTKMNIDYLLLLFPAGDEYVFDEDDFNITHMTTTEFNGSKEDLSKYDMIYFGNSTGKMNATSGKQSIQDLSGNWVSMTYTAPQYNDSADNDKIFLHVGDRIGGLNNERYRLSGNDVTSLKSAALEKYVKSGKALVLPDVLYMGNTSANPLFAKAVGTKTNTEAFLSNVRNKDNVYALNTLTTSNVINFANSGAAVKITGTPPIYNNPSDTTLVKDENSGTDNKKSITPIAQSEDGTYNLTFTFKIGYSSNKKETYAVRLLVDKNGDGIISENETGADIVDTWNSTVSAGQVFKPGTLNDEGEEQPAEYTVSYTIPEEQTNGPIAWKFMVYNTQNESIYYEVSGISLYKGEVNDAGETVIHEIAVLQVIADDKKNSKADLESDTAALFKKYAKLEDYTIDVKTITLSEYLKRFADVNGSGFTGNDSERTKFSQSGENFYYPTEYMDYHIFLYSCGKHLQSASNANGAISFAAWASNNDKSVIYTEDSIYASDSNTANRDMLKDTTGLSRFTSKDGTTMRYNDTATDASGKKYNASDYKSLEYTYHKATMLGSGANKYLAYKNEGTNQWLKVDNKTAMTYGTGEQKTTKGSRANNGTVCNYPYTIGEDLSLTGAKAQDYQLNLEIPDADVWYCLGDYQGRGNAAGKLNSYYAMSPNDGANNYYLFNVDNVFYDGINLENTTKDQEMQLFINTLIGAYEFSYGTPYVTVDKVTRIEDGEAEKLNENSITTAERRYSFEVSAGEKSVKTTMYKEYLAQEKDKVVHSVKPKNSAAPTAAPTEAPEPTKAPEPVTIWENQLNQNATTFTVSKSNGATWLENLSNDAVIQFTYTCTEEHDGETPVWDIYGGDNEWTKHGSFTACVGDSKKSTDIQVVQMTIGNLKQLLGVASGSDIKCIVIRPANYYCPYVRMLHVKLYQENFTGNFETGGSSEPGKPTVEEVKASEIFTDEDTHIIYFTPHEGNVKGAIIKSLMLQFTGMDNDENEAISIPVTTIYRSLGDGKYQKITCPEDMPGQFNESLVDGRQYFVTYNKENANEANSKVFNKLEMYIQNDRKEGKTILDIIPNAAEKPDSDEIYMFNLD